MPVASNFQPSLSIIGHREADRGGFAVYTCQPLSYLIGLKMAQTPLLDNRRKMLLYRAAHRGMKEMDLILGGFAARHLAGMDSGDLDVFEQMLEAPDQEFYRWISGAAPPPEQFDTPMLEQIRKFQPHRN